MEFKGLGFIPILLAFWCVAWLATSYITTIILGHAAMPLMHISEEGNLFPENILMRIGFIGMSIGTLGLTFCIYKFMVMHTEEFKGHKVLIQRILLAIVWTSCIGTGVEHTFSPDEYPRIHRVGMIISIACEALYYLGQSIQMYRLPGAKHVIRHSRCMCCGVSLLCTVFYIGYGILKDLFYNTEDWDQIREITSITIEWVMLLLVLINIVTYYSPMQRLFLTVSRKGCTLSLRVKIDDFGV